MVDEMNPTNQFHPYQAPGVVPHTERPAGGFTALLQKAGINASSATAFGDSLRNLDVKKSVEGARKYVRDNPGVLLGALAAVAIGAGLMRGRNSSR